MLLDTLYDRALSAVPVPPCGQCTEKFSYFPKRRIATPQTYPLDLLLRIPPFDRASRASKMASFFSCHAVSACVVVRSLALTFRALLSDKVGA